MQKSASVSETRITSKKYCKYIMWATSISNPRLGVHVSMVVHDTHSNKRTFSAVVLVTVSSFVSGARNEKEWSTTKP